MDDLTKIITAIFGTVALVAIVSVIVSRRSQAPQAIHAIGSAIGNVVAAAVNPVSANYGYGNGASAFSLPTASPIIDQVTSAFTSGSIIPGGFK